MCVCDYGFVLASANGFCILWPGQSTHLHNTRTLSHALSLLGSLSASPTAPRQHRCSNRSRPANRRRPGCSPHSPPCELTHCGLQAMYYSLVGSRRSSGQHPSPLYYSLARLSRRLWLVFTTSTTFSWLRSIVLLVHKASWVSQALSWL